MAVGLVSVGTLKDLHSKYDVKSAHELGRGACGSVFAVPHRITGDMFAMKTISLESMGADTFQELRAEIDTRVHRER